MKLPPVPSRPDLDALLKAAASIIMTPAEIWDQRVSFVYGNLMDNPRVTREMVRARATEMYGPRPTTYPETTT